MNENKSIKITKYQAVNSRRSLGMFFAVILKSKSNIKIDVCYTQTLQSILIHKSRIYNT